jgi:hypothetical protein
MLCSPGPYMKMADLLHKKAEVQRDPAIKKKQEAMAKVFRTLVQKESARRGIP